MSDHSVGTHDTRNLFRGGKRGGPVDCSCGESFDSEHLWHVHVKACPGARPLPCCRGTPWYEERMEKPR